MLPAARVHRSRLALALAVTMAALPVLVLDNLAATADEQPVAEVAISEAPVTTEATTTTEAPTTTAAPTTTVAPTTTAAPTPTTAKPHAHVVAAAPAPAPTTTTAPPERAYGDPDDPATWDRLAQCEAGGDWAANTGNGYYGGLQFSLGTWQSYGGTGYPHEASRETQITIGKRLQADQGWDAWPGCSRHLGYS